MTFRSASLLFCDTQILGHVRFRSMAFWGSSVFFFFPSAFRTQEIGGYGVPFIARKEKKLLSTALVTRLIHILLLPCPFFSSFQTVFWHIMYSFTWSQGTTAMDLEGVHLAYS